MAKPTSISINLLRSQEKGFIDKFLNWALTAGRFLILITETIALSVFAYRFTLDRIIVDLHDEIKQKQAIVAYLKNNEDTYRNLQQRLLLSKQLGESASTTGTLVKDVIGYARGNVVFRSFNLSAATLHVDIAAPSSSQLGQFVDQLKTHPQIRSVSVDKVETKPSSATIIVNITAALKVNAKGALPIQKADL